MHTSELRDRIGPVAETEGLRLVVLFGSSTRAEGPGQDLDLALQGEHPLDLVHLTNRLAPALGRQDLDVVDLRVADPVLLLSVAEEGVPLYESEPGAYARFQSLAARRFFDTHKFREMERLEIHDFLRRRREAS